MSDRDPHSITAARGHRWPLSRDQHQRRAREQLFPGLRAETWQPAIGRRDATCEHGYHECVPCGTARLRAAFERAPKPATAQPSPAAAPVPARDEREGWTFHAPCGGGWSCCYHFAGAPGIHVFQNNTTLGDAPGSHHYVTKHRFGAGEPQAFGGTRLECQLHVEAKLAAAQPKARAAVQPKRRLGASYSCLDCDVENDRACIACTAEAAEPAPAPQRGERPGWEQRGTANGKPDYYGFGNNVFAVTAGHWLVLHCDPGGIYETAEPAMRRAEQIAAKERAK